MLSLLYSFLVFLSPQAFVDPLISQKIKSQGYADVVCILKTDLFDLAKITDTYESKDSKGQYVYTKLKSAAQRSQSELIGYLFLNKIQHSAFYIINAIHIPKTDANLLFFLSHLPEVLRLEYNSTFTHHRPEVIHQDLQHIETRGQVVQWGISRIKADTLWSLGIKGKGVVIGGEDTGVELHPVLKANYRGTQSDNTINNNHNWHDAIHSLHPLNRDTTANEYNNPCGLDTIGPCDDDNHGTHTMGTMNANDQQIGVAPEAKWIACRCMERGWGTLTTYIECFEWFLAPTDINHKNPDPKKAPHVINNSWGCPPEEGCNLSNFATMDQVIKNLKAAGIFVTASAGNSGSRGCSSIDGPAAIFEAAFTVGASNIGDSIAGFSSRGPVIVDSSNRMKPNVAAPGVGTISAIRNGGYASFQGTSMAGPHVSGAVALLISAFPGLAGNVNLIEDILEQSADVKFQRISCGGEKANGIPNNTYGFGIINVYKAYELAKKLVTTGIKPDTRLYNLKVYPNPVANKIYFEAIADDKLESVRILDAYGRLVLTSNAVDASIIMLELSLPAGIYYYSVVSDKSRYTGKIIVSK